MLREFEPGVFDARRNYTGAQLTTVVLDELSSHWIPADGEMPLPAHMLPWFFDRFGFDDMTTPSLQDLDRAVDSRMLLLRNISLKVKEAENRNEDFRDGEIKGALIRVAKLVVEARKFSESAVLCVAHLDGERYISTVSPPNSETYIAQLLCQDKDKLTSYQQLLSFLLRRLEVAGFRKLGDYCYKEIVLPDPEDPTGGRVYKTHAWKQEMSIKDFVERNVQKETEYEQWKNSTCPAANSILVQTYLRVENHLAEFPLVTVDRYVWAFDNGLYNVRSDMFFPFARRPEWPEMAADIQAYRRALRDEEGGASWNEPTGAPYVCAAPVDSTVAVTYLPHPFRYEITPETESGFTAASIKLPELEQIFKSQKLDEATKQWTLLMMARLFFPVGEYDNWQVLLFIKGVAGSGKSTLARLIRYLYPGTLVSTLSSNIESKFGLSAIYEGLVCVCSEVREDFGLDQGDWQSAVSAEEVQIAVKGKTAFQHKWTTSLFFLGNELPDYRNNSSSVSRRMVMVEFANKVRGSDPTLFDRMIGNVDHFMRKGTRLYIAARCKHRATDIWSKDPQVLPPQLHKYRDDMRLNLEPLYYFMIDEFVYSTVLPESERDGTCPRIAMKDFNARYQAFRKENGMKRETWCPIHYSATFDEFSVVVVNETFDHQGGRYTGKWILGLELKETIDASGDTSAGVDSFAAPPRAIL